MKASMYNMFIPCTRGFAAFNTLNGSILFVDEEMKAVLEKGELHRLTQENCDALTRVGFIVDDALDERKVFSLQLKNLIYSPGTANFSLLPTYSCNLACPYCYEGSGEIHRGTMSEDMEARIIQGIKTYCMNTGVHNLGITLYGGEPLLHKKTSVHLVKTLGDWAHSQGMNCTCSMITNGTLVTEETLAEFEPYLKMIQVTLDGPHQYHDSRRIQKNGEGTYEKIMNAVTTARKKGILVMIRIQVAKDNVSGLETLFEDMVRRGFHKDEGIHAYLFPLMEINEVCSSYASLCSEEEAKMLPELWRKGRNYGLEFFSKPTQVFISPYCSFAAKDSFLVDALGDVYKCVSVVGDTRYRVARMSEKGITDITPEMYNFTVRDPADIGACSSCVLLPLCGGGCAHRAFQKHHTYEAGDCTLHKGLEEEKLRLYLEKNYPTRFSDASPSKYNLFFKTEDKRFLLLNTFKRSRLLVDQELKETVERGEFHGVNPEIVRQLSAHSILVTADELSQFTSLYERRVCSPFEYEFTLLPWYRCNLNCYYCTHSEKILSPDQLQKFKEFFSSELEKGKFENVAVRIAGGEPLMYPDILSRILRDLSKIAEEHSKKFFSGMATNGTLLTKEILDELSSINAVQLTFEGDRNYHDTVRYDLRGTFDRVLKSAEMIRDAGILLNMRVHVSEKNVQGLEELFSELHSRIGIGMEYKTMITAAPVIKTRICPLYPSRCTESFDAVRLLPQAWEAAKRSGIIISGLPHPPYEMLPCPYVTPTSIVIDPDGKGYKCLLAAGEHISDVGSVEEGIYSPFNRELWHDQCASCQLLPLCGGGCAWRRSSGDPCGGTHDLIMKQVTFYLRNENRIVD